MMIVLDTNVISDLMNPEGSSGILVWIDAFKRMQLFTTAVNQAEILYGLAVMPKGKRRDQRIAWADSVFEEDFRGRILAFESRAAAHYVDIVATRRRIGKPIEPVDAQIAAIARANGMSLATRDVADFHNCGIELINPGRP